MLRPIATPTTICPQCALPGIHATISECLVALRAERLKFSDPPPIEPAPIAAPTGWPEIATVKEAMAIAKVSRRTINYWMTAGKIRFFRTAGGQPRIYVDSLFRTGTA